MRAEGSAEPVAPARVVARASAARAAANDLTRFASRVCMRRPERRSWVSWAAPETMTSAQPRPRAWVTSKPARSSPASWASLALTRTSCAVPPPSSFGSPEATVRSVIRAREPAPARRQASATRRRPPRTQPCTTSLPPKPRELATRLPAVSRTTRSQSPLPRRRTSTMPVTAARYVVAAQRAPSAGASVRTEGASSFGTRSAPCAGATSESAAATPSMNVIVRDICFPSRRSR